MHYKKSTIDMKTKWFESLDLMLMKWKNGIQIKNNGSKFIHFFPIVQFCIGGIDEKYRTIVQEKTGRDKRVIYDSEPPINCEHNLYYNQLFNSADAIWLVQNMDIVLRKLADEYSTSTKTEREEAFHHYNKEI